MSDLELNMGVFFLIRSKIFTLKRTKCPFFL